MCDDDIIYLMKNSFYSQLSEEFFERRIRRHPVWKSEAEYKASDSWVIDDSLIAKLEKETLITTEIVTVQIPLELLRHTVFYKGIVLCFIS